MDERQEGGQDQGRGHASFDPSDTPQFACLAKSLGVTYSEPGWLRAHATFPFWIKHKRLEEALTRAAASGEQREALAEFASLMWGCASADPALRFEQDNLAWLGERIREHGAVPVITALLAAATGHGHPRRG